MENKQEVITVEGEQKVSLRTQEGLIAIAQTYLTKNGNVILPPNYDVNDAVKSLYLATLQTKDKQGRPALEVCTKESIEQVVQNYVSKGLNVAKHQCYPIVYGNTLTLSESYFGKEKQVKQHAKLFQKSSVIYKGEDFKVIKRSDGANIVEHTPDFSKWDTDNIIGAYSVASYEDGKVYDTEVMTIQELKKTASKSQTGGTVYKDFPVEMYRKIPVARQAKHIINSSDDSAKFTLENDVNYDYEEINADIVIEDEKSTTPKKPTKHEQEEVEMTVDELGEEETKEILYREFYNNKSKYRAVPNSYKEEEQEDGHIKKTIRVYC